MPIYACILNNELKKLGHFGEILSQYNISPTLFVFKSQEEGRLGFEQSIESEAAALNFIRDAWYLDKSSQEARAVEGNRNSLSTMWAAVTPLALMVVEPDSKLMEEFEKVSQYRKIRIKKELYKKYGKTGHFPTPPMTLNLFEEIERWTEDCLSFVLEHSKGIIIWRFGAGEYGLHCVAISNSPFPANLWLVGGTAEGSVQVSKLSEVPAW